MNINFGNVKDEELININLITTILYLISLFISVSLIYNDRKVIRNEQRLYTDKQSKSIFFFNRIFIIILACSYLYVNHETKKLAKIKGKDLKNFNLQIDSSLLSILADIIVLYVAYDNLKNLGLSQSTFENPEL